MRTRVGFEDTSSSAVSSPETTAASVARGEGGTRFPHSAWHSPVPYLFGGLAAMLGLIAFALLVLACSSWKLSELLESDSAEEVESKAEAEEKTMPARYEERIVVIMAGDEKPRYLATPTCKCSSSSSGSEGDHVGTNKLDAVEGLSSSSRRHDEDNQLNDEQNQV